MNDVEATQTRIRGNQNYLKDSVKKKVFYEAINFFIRKTFIGKVVFHFFFWFHDLIMLLL